MLKVLITGADGFVGAHLAKALTSEGTEVVGVVKSSTGAAFDRYEERVVDLSAPDFVAQLPAKADVVIHLAQSLGYRDFPNAAPDIFAVNVASTAKLLEWARTSGVGRFVFASTGNVYTPSTSPLVETDPCEPASFYGATKLAAELMVRQYEKLFETVVLRIFGVYGPGQRAMIVHDMIQRVRSNADITLGQGRGLVFSPMYITDCIDVLRGMATRAEREPGAVYNLGGREAVDLKQLVDVVSSRLGASPNVRTTENPPTHLVGDCSKLFSKIGFRPQVTFDRGLALTVDALN